MTDSVPPSGTITLSRPPTVDEKNDPQREIPTNPENPAPTEPPGDARGDTIVPPPHPTLARVDGYLGELVQEMAKGYAEIREFRREWFDHESRRARIEEANWENMRRELLNVRQALAEVQDRVVRHERRLLLLEERVERLGGAATPTCSTR